MRAVYYKKLTIKGEKGQTECMFDSHTHAWKQNQYYYDPRGDQKEKKIGSISTNMLWIHIWIKGNPVIVLKNLSKDRSSVVQAKNDR